MLQLQVQHEVALKLLKKNIVNCRNFMTQASLEMEQSVYPANLPDLQSIGRASDGSMIGILPRTG